MKRLHPRLPLQDGLAWFALGLLLYLLAMVFINGPAEVPFKISLIVFVTCCIFVLLGLILLRGLLLRRAGRANMRDRGAIGYVPYSEGECVSLNEELSMRFDPGWMLVEESRISFWTYSGVGASASFRRDVHSDVVTEARVERLFGVLTYPSLVIQLANDDVIRLALIKPRGPSWRDGATYAESCDAVALVESGLGRHVERK